MSDYNHSSHEERLIKTVRAMKADVDGLYAQLRSGAYASLGTFANNWGHLIRVVNEMKPMLSEPGVAEMLVLKDVELIADLLAMTHSVEII